MLGSIRRGAAPAVANTAGGHLCGSVQLRPGSSGREMPG